MAAIDTFKGRNTIAGYTGGEAVAPSDTVDQTNVSRALYVGVAGDVTVVMRDGQALLLKAMPVGLHHNVRIKRVNLTGTAATNMVVLW